MRAVIVDERGNVISAPIDFLESVLPGLNDTRYGFLRYINPYGDTFFNCLQIPMVQKELRLWRDSLAAKEERAIVEQIISLCAGSTKEPHCYLKFIGD